MSAFTGEPAPSRPSCSPRKTYEGPRKTYEPWTEEEDRIVKKLVEECGTKKWMSIAELLKKRYKNKERSSKQIRERWHNHLCEAVKKDKWTDEEEQLLFELQKKYGNKWTKIAQHMPGRSDNQVKNHYHSAMRRGMRLRALLPPDFSSEIKETSARTSS